jgi:hypothetical protein
MIFVGIQEGNGEKEECADCGARKKASPERGGVTAGRRDGEVFARLRIYVALCKMPPFQPLSRLRRQLPFQGSHSEGGFRNGCTADAGAEKTQAVSACVCFI